MAHEVNFDGIVGPTHHYGGLAWGNTASLRHRLLVSHPRQAALQGLAKMKLLMDLGVKQAVLPPQERPDLRTLRRLGFEGTDGDVVRRAWRDAPQVLSACYSASAMWAANAATVSPSVDTHDQRVHFTPANLSSHFHRSLEPQTTAAMLRMIFPDERHFVHHDPLPAGMHLCDEGAANHMRLCAGHDGPGIEIFTFGRRAFDQLNQPRLSFPARQTCEASAAVARLHRLDQARTLFIQQDPAAIDSGVFHNDVIAVSNQHVLLYHERAFRSPAETIRRIGECFFAVAQRPPLLIEVREDDVELPDAVRSYLFNSQLVSLPEGTMALIVPTDCDEVSSTRRWLSELPQRGTPIQAVHRVDIRQSMKNGGGPACLRLRVLLDDVQLSKVHPGVMLTNELYGRLCDWVRRHYRESLRPDELADPHLIDEGRTALDELTRLLVLGTIYAFQRS